MPWPYRRAEWPSLPGKCTLAFHPNQPINHSKNDTYRAKDWYTTRQETAGHFSGLPGRNEVVGIRLVALTPTRISFPVKRPHRSSRAGSRCLRCSKN